VLPGCHAPYQALDDLQRRQIDLVGVPDPDEDPVGVVVLPWNFLNDLSSKDRPGTVLNDRSGERWLRNRPGPTADAGGGPSPRDVFRAKDPGEELASRGQDVHGPDTHVVAWPGGASHGIVSGLHGVGSGSHGSGPGLAGSHRLRSRAPWPGPPRDRLRSPAVGRPRWRVGSGRSSRRTPPPDRCVRSAFPRPIVPVVPVRSSWHGAGPYGSVSPSGPGLREERTDSIRSAAEGTEPLGRTGSRCNSDTRR